MSLIYEGMPWPPTNFLTWKAAEHSAWYSGDSEILANFYTGYLAKNVLDLPYTGINREQFWGRQIKNQGEIVVHVPIAGDIAETSANFLFSESPTIKVVEAHEASANSTYKKSQSLMDIMLEESGFFRKILEGAEACAAIGGVYIKIAWDNEISDYPIPVVVQSDRAVPEFTFGILTAVTFWKVVREEKSGSVIWRLLERYEKGGISYTLYKGTSDRLGRQENLKAIEETQDQLEYVITVDELLVVYVPNILPNRLDRNSYLGRSDYAGIEGLMDSLDEVFSSWVKDIALAQGKILIPESFLGVDARGNKKHNLDTMVYVTLDIDPTSVDGAKITVNQFEIRADEFEKTSLNLMDRIITSAGYSPQSFGLNIQGRAESGTALSMRERKSFATKGKKEKYWGPALRRLVQLMTLVYNEELSGSIDADAVLSVAFSDGVTNDVNELSNSIKLLSDAMAASTYTKVAMLHPDWDKEQIEQEVKVIIEENNLGPQEPPDLTGGNLFTNPNDKSKQV